MTSKQSIILSSLYYPLWFFPFRSVFLYKIVIYKLLSSPYN